MEKEDAKDYSGESRSLQLTTHRPGGEVLALGTDMDEVRWISPGKDSEVTVDVARNKAED